MSSTVFKEYNRKYDTLQINTEYMEKYNKLYDIAKEQLQSMNYIKFYDAIANDLIRDEHDCGPEFTRIVADCFDELRKEYLPQHDYIYLTDLTINVGFAIEAAVRDWLIEKNNYPFWIPK